MMRKIAQAKFSKVQASREIEKPQATVYAIVCGYKTLG